MSLRLICITIRSQLNSPFELAVLYRLTDGSNWTYTPSTSEEGKQANGSGPLKQQITQAVVLGLG